MQIERPLGWTFRLAVLIAVARLFLSSYWALTLPPFEAHDETGHFTYAHFIAREGRLPYPAQLLTEWFDESHQPPLYYLLAAMAGRPFAPTEPYLPTMNPFFLSGDGRGGVNAILHDPELERFPGGQAQQFLLAGRLSSAVFSGVAVFFVFLATRLLLPTWPAAWIGATGLAAFTPTWVFVGGAMTNDALVALMGTLTLWSCVRLLRDRQPGAGAFAVAGVTLGLAVMSKNNALILVPFAGLAALVAMRGLWGGSARVALARGAAFAGCAALVAGPWYFRNLLVLGRPLGDRETTNVILSEITPVFETVGKREPFDFLAGLVSYTFRTYWGLFGWGTIALPDWFYVAAAAATGVAVLGLTRVLAARDDATRGVLLLAAFAALVVSLPLYRAIFFNTPTLLPGRYLLPAIAATSALLAVGLCALPGRLGKLLPSIALGGAFLVSAATPSLIVAPQFRQPPRLTSEEVSRVATPASYTYDGRARLTGYHTSRDRAHPGEEVEVTLFWQVIAPFDRPYTMGLHLIDERQTSRAATNSWPGRGNYSTVLWRPGEVFADIYRLKIPDSAAAPFLGHLRPRLHDFAPTVLGSTQFRYRGDLPVVDANGSPTSPVLGMIAVEAPPRGLPAAGAPLATFGSTVQLDGYSVSSADDPGKIGVELTWRALSKPEERLVAFVHVLDSTGRIIAQSDSEPVGGLYPTVAWRKDEQVVDRHSLTLSPAQVGARLRLAVGLYRRDGLERLPAATGSGELLPQNVLVTESALS